MTRPIDDRSALAIMASVIVARASRTRDRVRQARYKALWWDVIDLQRRQLEREQEFYDFDLGSRWELDMGHGPSGEDR